MDPENQQLIKELVDKHGADDVVVVLGATDPEALEIAVETVTAGDPSFMGPLAGVPLGLHVLHIFDDTLKTAVPTEIYEHELGFLEMTLDADDVRSRMQSLRDTRPQ